MALMRVHLIKWIAFIFNGQPNYYILKTEFACLTYRDNYLDTALCSSEKDDVIAWVARAAPLGGDFGDCTNRSYSFGVLFYYYYFSYYDNSLNTTELFF